MKTSRVVQVVLQLSALVVALGTGRLAAAPNEAFLGRWALTLPNGAAGWLEITKEKGYYDGSILWGGGSVLPVSSVVITSRTETSWVNRSPPASCARRTVAAALAPSAAVRCWTLAVARSAAD